MVKYVEPAQLATWLQQDTSKYLVIDVRDDDYEVRIKKQKNKLIFCRLEKLMAV